MKKLDLHNAAALTAFAMQKGMVTRYPPLLIKATK